MKFEDFSNNISKGGLQNFRHSFLAPDRDWYRQLFWALLRLSTWKKQLRLFTRAAYKWSM